MIKTATATLVASLALVGCSTEAAGIAVDDSGYAGVKDGATEPASDGASDMTSDDSAAAPITVTLAEAAEAFPNPLIGFRPSRGPRDSGFRNHEFASTYKHYIAYSDLESSAADGVEKMVAWSTANWAGLAARNRKVIPRVVIAYPGVGEFWGDLPHDGTPSQWGTDALKTRLVAFAAKLGKAWDGDPRVAAVEMGLWGKWGEHHIYPDKVGDSSVIPTSFQEALGDAFQKAFTHKKVLVRYPETFTKLDTVGFYWDSFALPDDDNAAGGKGIVARDVFRTQMVSGEVAYDWGDQSRLGGSPEGTLRSDANTDYVIGYINKLHASSLGWISDYTPDHAVVSANAARMQKAMGYRFVIDEATFDTRVSPGGVLHVSLRVRNAAAAPFYYDWPLEISLLRLVDGKPVVAWKGLLPGVDLRKWLPRPATYSVEGTVAPSLANGTYVLAVCVVDPANGAPALRFANGNYYRGGRTPIGKVGVGEVAADQNLGTFDALAGDDTLSYGP